jgi:hypothetical protein
MTSAPQGSLQANLPGDGQQVEKARLMEDGQWRLPLGVVPGEVLSVVVVVEGGERGFRLGGRSARDFGVARAREATS